AYVIDSFDDLRRGCHARRSRVRHDLANGNDVEHERLGADAERNEAKLAPVAHADDTPLTRPFASLRATLSPQAGRGATRHTRSLLPFSPLAGRRCPKGG